MDDQFLYTHQASVSRLRALSPDVPGAAEVERMAARAYRIEDVSQSAHTRSRRVLTGALASVVVVAAVVLLAGRFRLDAVGERATVADAAADERFQALVFGADERATSDSALRDTRASTASPAHSIMMDALDGDWAPGVSLWEALTTIGWTPSLPDEALVGKPVKVVVDDLGKVDPMTFGLLIKYDSDIKLFTQYGETDFAEELARLGPPSNGYPLPVLEDVAGRVSVVNPGDGRLPKVVSWSLRGCTYSLRSSSSTVDIEQLKQVAASIR